MEIILKLQDSIKTDCHGCQEALTAMLLGLQMGFMRISTLPQGEKLHSKLPQECRIHCLSGLSVAIEALEAGEFSTAWENLSRALAAVKSRTRT